MFEIVTLVVFIWLMVKAIGLAFKLTWGIANIIASIIIVLAFPALIVCMIFVGGITMLVPLILIVIAAGILKACV